MSKDRPVDPEFEAQVQANRWHDRTEFDAFVAKIKELSGLRELNPEGNYAQGSRRWTWSRNWTCKYVSLRVDMRDGGFILVDDAGKRINLAALEWQYTPKEPSDAS